MKIIYDDGTEKDFGDEPLFILRGQDEHTPGTIAYYNMLCRSAGNTKQVREVNKAFNEMRAWQKENKEKVKKPDHKHRPVGMVVPQEPVMSCKCPHDENGKAVNTAPCPVHPLASKETQCDA